MRSRRRASGKGTSPGNDKEAGMGLTAQSDHGPVLKRTTPSNYSKLRRRASIGSTTENLGKVRRRTSFGYGIVSSSQTQSQHVCMLRLLRSMSDTFSEEHGMILSQQDLEAPDSDVQLEHSVDDQSFSQLASDFLDQISETISEQIQQRKKTERIILSHLKTALARNSWESRMGAALSMRRFHTSATTLANQIQATNHVIEVRREFLADKSRGDNEESAVYQAQQSIDDCLSSFNSSNMIRSPTDTELLTHLDLVADQIRF